MKKSPITKQPHPLEDIVLEALAEQNNLDATSPGAFLAGTDVRPVSLGYVLVARDVLASMESSGKLRCDMAGRYWLRNACQHKRGKMTYLHFDKWNDGRTSLNTERKLRLEFAGSFSGGPPTCGSRTSSRYR